MRCFNFEFWGFFMGRVAGGFYGVLLYEFCFFGVISPMPPYVLLLYDLGGKKLLYKI